MTDTFLSQRYPTVEQTLANNVSSLYQQKRLLLADLRSLIGSVGCVLIAIAYLRDVSFIPVFFRLVSQLSLSVATKTFSQLSLSPAEKAEQRMFLLFGVVAGALISITLHLIYGSYKSSDMRDHQLHGGFTVQFIGERVPYGTWELLLFDTLIFCSQYVYFCIMWVADDLAILLNPVADISSDEVPISNELISDGFDGNVFILTIDLWGCLVKSLEKARETNEQELVLGTSTVMHFV